MQVPTKTCEVWYGKQTSFTTIKVHGITFEQQFLNYTHESIIHHPSNSLNLLRRTKNGQDNTGVLSERLVDDIFANEGYTAVDPSILGTQGFDNVLIKRDASGNIEDVIINESKQLSNTSSGFQMSSVQGTGNSNCNNCRQLSDDWVDDVLERMNNSSSTNAQNLSTELRNFIDNPSNNITKVMSGVDRTTGELILIKVNF